MINVSSAWKRTLFDDKRDFKNYVKITLTDNTVLNLTNENLWEGGIAIDDAVSSEGDFQVGCAIINKATFIINNIYGDYDAYDFDGARVEVKIGLDVGGVADEEIKKGKYIVNEAVYNGQLINIECYDYMYFFDVPYSQSSTTYPADIDTIVRTACTELGVTLNTYNFPHKTYVIQNPPSEANTTYREVLAWCAQICGCFARCNNEGQLELKWYPQSDLNSVISGLDGGEFDSSTPYASGDTADGGSFDPWSTGYVYDGGALNWNYNVHLLRSIYSQSVSVDDVVITGLKVTVKVEDDDQSGQSEKTITYGQAGYVIDLTGNGFINGSNATEILTWLGTQLIGFTFRKANITHSSDPSIEAGDCAIIFDRNQNVYPIVVSVTRFSSGGAQNTVSSAQTPLRNSAARFSAETKNYVELRKRIKNERTTREAVEAQLASAIQNAGGLYFTAVTDDDTTLYYLHNKPQLNESAVRILVSDVGITVTPDRGTHWYGLTVDGNLISNILTTTGINADWINSGAISIQDQNQTETFYANTSTGEVRIRASSFYLVSNGTSRSISDVAKDATLEKSSIYTGSDIPTNSNYPASDWSSTQKKQEHVGDIYVRSNGDQYQYMYARNGLRITFSGDCATESTSFDYVIIYYRVDDLEEFATEKYGGTGSSNNIANAVVDIPATSFYLYWHSDFSNHNYHGFSISSIEPIAVGGAIGSLSRIPTQYSQIDVSGSTYPETSHPYSDNQDLFWKYTYDSSYIDRGPSYQWVRIQDSAVPSLGANVNTLSSDVSSLDSDVSSLSASVTILSGQISSKVSAGDIASTINQTAQSVLISASKINMSGFVEFSDLSTSGSSTINGDNVSTGTISATSSRFKIFLNLGQIQIYGNNNTNYCVILDSAHIDLDAPKQGSQYYATFTRMEQVDDNTIGGQFYLHSYGSAKFDFTNVNFVHDASISGNFTVSGTKNREVDTDDYGKRLLYCYETATPYFGDIGSGVIGSDGYSYIQIDPILLETISNDDYHVFLQKCGSGDCYVERKERSYFVVCGTPNLKFSWELKAKQCDFDQRRLEDSSNDCTIYETDFGKYATDHINELREERMMV